MILHGKPESWVEYGVRMEGHMFWILAILAACCVGFSKGGAPVFGSLAVPILSLQISPLTAAGLLLPVFVFSDIFGVYAYRRYVNWRVFRIAAIGILVGTGLGWATAHMVSENLVRLLVGLIGIAFALRYLRGAEWQQSQRRPGKLRGILWTSIAGFTSFVSHSGAPPWQIWAIPLGLPKMIFVGTTAVTFAYMNALKLLPYYMLGQLHTGHLRITLLLCVPAALAVFAAYRLVAVLPERIYFALVTWMLFAISLKLVADGLTGMLGT